MGLGWRRFDVWACLRGHREPGPQVDVGDNIHLNLGQRADCLPSGAVLGNRAGECDMPRLCVHARQTLLPRPNFRASRRLRGRLCGFGYRAARRAA